MLKNQAICTFVDTKDISNFIKARTEQKLNLCNGHRICTGMNTSIIKLEIDLKHFSVDFYFEYQFLYTVLI